MCGSGEPWASSSPECAATRPAYELETSFSHRPRNWLTSTSSHVACGWVVDIKPGRRPNDDGHHALFAWCPASSATSREVVDLAELDLWLNSGTTTVADRSEFARAKPITREWLTSS